MIKQFSAKSDELFFDPKNPRLVGDFGDDQDKMFRFLITDIGVEDLLESLATTGIFEADPIIVRKRSAGGHYVIEGNRRLAALKLLTGKRPNDDQPLPAIPPVSSKLAESFKTIQVETDWPEDKLQAYLGYKHVTASREWTPEAKAKFVFVHAQGDYTTENLRKFAKSLGTRYPTLKRWIVAYLTLKQAEKKQLFDADLTPSRGYFGTFYTLLGGLQARNFLSLQDDPISENPIPEDHLEELGEFVKWTIGIKDDPAKVNSRQQKQFEQVLSSPRALKHFRVKGDLTASLLYTEYNAEEIASKFREAAYSIEDCLTKLFDVKANENVKEAFSELEGAYRKAKVNMKQEEQK